MFAGLIVAICALLILPLHRLLEQTLPRRYGTLRPRLEWLTLGISSLLAFSLLGLLFPNEPGLALPRAFAFVFGIWAIAYFAHRRVCFRARGVYEYRFGVPWRACRYSSVSQCEAGKNIVHEGLLLHLEPGDGWGVPGLMPGHQIAEAIWLLQRAGLSMPSEDELRTRLGVDYGRVQAARPMRP